MNAESLALDPGEVTLAQEDFAQVFLTSQIRRVREHLTRDALGGYEATHTFAQYPARLRDLSLPREVLTSAGEVVAATQMLQVPLGADIREDDTVEMPSGARYAVIALAEPRTHEAEPMATAQVALRMAQRLWCRPLSRSPGQMEGEG